MIDFLQHPEIALTAGGYDSSIHKTAYRYNYEQIFEDIACGRVDDRGVYRSLVLNDLFFIVCFVMGIEKANHPFVVNQCAMVQDGLRTNTLDIWFRGGYKSTIVTQAETIQYELSHPSHCTGIFAYSRPAAKKFLRGIKSLLETSDLLKYAFPDILFGKPESESPKWSLDINTPVLTVKGWKRHGDLVPGDKIFGSKGQVITVTGNSGPQTGVACRRVVFDDCELIASSEHLWPVQIKQGIRWDKPRIGIFETDKLPIKNKYRRMLTTPVVDMPSNGAEYPVDPYILGLWLGDGTIGTNIISMHNDDEAEMLSQFSNLKREYYIHRKKPEDNFSMYGVRCLKEDIDSIGCLREKHIPESYLFGTKEVRLSLLQGLMDSDGTCKKDGPSRCKGMCMFSNTNKNLADGVFFLASSLGLRPSVCSFIPKSVGKRRVYHVYFIGIKSTPPFRLTRKLSNCKDKRHQDGRYLRKVEAIPSVTVNCIKVDAEDSLYLAGCSMVPTHNSEDDGLVLKRPASSRGESSIEAWGLTEGMPTGRHFERCVFDDLETEDIRESPDMLEKVFSKFEMAQNLGTGSQSDVQRVIGTYYSHFGPNVRIRDKVYPDGRKVYDLRLVPGSDDGTKMGNPILWHPDIWEKLKTGQHFNSQQLCDPTPESEIKLDFSLMRPIEPQFLPKNRLKFVLVDPAGDDEVTKGTHNDNWAMGCISVEPVMDDLGTSRIYIEDVEYGHMTLSEAIDAAVGMYIRNGRVIGLGVERVGTDTTYEHIRKGLLARGRHVKIKKTARDGGNLVLLSPDGKKKNRRVESALAWPLNNGKVYYSTALDGDVIQEIKEECAKFPFFHVDILDMVSYVYKLVEEMRFNFALLDELDDEFDEPDLVVVQGRSKVGGY